MTNEQLDYLFDYMIKVASILIRQNKFNYTNEDLNELKDEFKVLFPHD